jgi:hypothetical protein
MQTNEVYKGFTIKGWSRNYRTYDQDGKEIGWEGWPDTRGCLLKQIREDIIDKLVDNTAIKE